MGALVTAANYRGRLGVVGTPAVSQAARAYELVKQEILACVLAPGQRITESELAERYGLGRAAVRTALNRLYQEALVDSMPRYGYVVTGEEEITERGIHELQLILEPSVMRMAAGRVDAEYLRALDADCLRASHVDSPEAAMRFLQANTRFHTAVAASTGNALLSRFVRILFERQERMIYATGRAEEVVRRVAHHHGEAVERLIAGQADEAEEAARSLMVRNHGLIADAIDSLPVKRGEFPPT